MPRRKRNPATNLTALARYFGDEHWREVIRLFVAMAPRSLFEAFIKEVVAVERLKGNHEFTALCLREALQPSEHPFLVALSDPSQRYDALQALSVLRDLTPEPMRRLAEKLNAEPERFFKTAPSNLPDAERDLAARLIHVVMPEARMTTAPQDTEPVVFISYSARDKALVDRIRSKLENAGVAVWQDTSEIKPGEVIARRIEEGVTACTFFLPVLSPHFQASRWTQFEDNLAWQREVEEGRVVVVPVLLRGDVRSLPLRYRQRHVIDLRRDFATGIKNLVGFLRGPLELPSVRINPIDGSELILIPKGPFKAGDAAFPDNRPKERELPDFYLARYPVTNAQYKKYLGANPKASRPDYWDDARFNQPDQPVVGVSFTDAEGYCRWAGLRLPTEWEWEKGARGKEGRPYPWGKQKPSKDLANFSMNIGQPTPVGSYPRGASPYGLLDMAGNVWEWTASLYKQGEKWRSVRGGSFFIDLDYLHAAFRSYFHPDFRRHVFGFRSARDP